MGTAKRIRTIQRKVMKQEKMKREDEFFRKYNKEREKEKKEKEEARKRLKRADIKYKRRNFRRGRCYYKLPMRDHRFVDEDRELLKL